MGYIPVKTSSSGLVPLSIRARAAEASGTGRSHLYKRHRILDGGALSGTSYRIVSLEMSSSSLPNNGRLSRQIACIVPNTRDAKRDEGG